MTKEERLNKFIKEHPTHPFVQFLLKEEQGIRTVEHRKLIGRVARKKSVVH